MFKPIPVAIGLRYLRAKRKEGGVATIAVISFIGIMLAVAVLISVMSIMAGFRSTLLDRMLSFNGHMYVQGSVLVSEDREARLRRIQPCRLGARLVQRMLLGSELVLARLRRAVRLA